MNFHGQNRLSRDLQEATLRVASVTFLLIEFGEYPPAAEARNPKGEPGVQVPKCHLQPHGSASKIRVQPLRSHVYANVSCRGWTPAYRSREGWMSGLPMATTRYEHANTSGNAGEWERYSISYPLNDRVTARIQALVAHVRVHLKRWREYKHM
ncbi:uncharacterized protein EI90DRAFT_647408 [Cantharellus anzutake]|uniref:uncharacterized protein n=1 Tax=Cantharellus anzutake TaxID=1750568 RepID=UPI001908A2F6|nr:uncharacterized protein EI90DRAFT_647408 [Cantharellus anzutake]KAF8333255.1 hypothetical protein EI90DRAFT_647408 [Cantharellus anzutake]